MALRQTITEAQKQSDEKEGNTGTNKHFNRLSHKKYSLNAIKETITSYSLTECVTNVLDKFAPIKSRVVTIRPAAPWINLVVKASKQARRKAERMFKKTGLTKFIEKFINITKTKL